MCLLSSICLSVLWGCNTNDPFRTAIYRAQEKQILKHIQQIKNSNYSWTPQNRAKRKQLEAELKKIQFEIKSTS